MALACIAASVRADAGAIRRISIDGLSPHDTELVTLLFQILGWQVVAAGPDGVGDGVADGDGNSDGDGDTARLIMRQGDDVVQVHAADDELAARMAATGLDRLAMPLNLAALEHLGVLAG